MSDSFDAAGARTPTAIGPLTLTLVVEGGAEGNVYKGGYHFEVRDASGEPMGVRQGNLIPHLTAAQKTAAQNFLDAMLTKAQGTVT